VIRRGSYQSALPLLRQAVEFIGGQRGLDAELDEWRRWTHEAYGRFEAARATEIGLGHYFAGSAIAAEEHLRLIYRATSDLAAPTALFVASRRRTALPAGFGDRAFHSAGQVILGGAHLGARSFRIAAPANTSPRRSPRSRGSRARGRRCGRRTPAPRGFIDEGRSATC
jgi:hypothetical protein